MSKSCVTPIGFAIVAAVSMAIQTIQATETSGFGVVQNGSLRVLVPAIGICRSSYDMRFQIGTNVTPNHALQRTRPSRSGCNRSVRWAGSLSLGR